ncbi:uncharacterized protein LOC142980269 isoform X2 [Anticarsia gemmatalis]|uniref:uncharacterized protein LOC142980269 isoform X2 n=1 Tax=Anticarsia gemmatalis TaxID=129554 RepID=UPI003F776C18
MTSETETLKTNEFLRRRKLRLQQVREQSKDIAKKIRQRAKVETLRQVVDLDAKKQKEYFDRQEKLVKRLEVLYARGVNNVGASHQSASDLTQQDTVTKTDLSKLRGKEAAAELRKKRQDKLDEQKKLLDRKLQARETANELSREKSSVVANKLLSKSTTSKVSDDTTQKAVSSTEVGKESTKDGDSNKIEQDNITKNDMATQWEVETMPNEWEPAVPALVLPKDDIISLKDDDNVEKSKRLDLFALSKEMPSDLRGRHVVVSETRESVRPSLTLVSEYLQSRKLRLRETDPPTTNRRQTDDIHNLKQTILRTRSSKNEGSPFSVCHVLDEQVIPMPSWHAERGCEFCAQSINKQKSSVQARQFKSVTNSQINRIFSSITPEKKPAVVPSPVLRTTSPFRRNKMCQRLSPGRSSVVPDTTKPDVVLSRKSSVQLYNHQTRDTRDMPQGDEPLVVRDLQTEEDAYSQAMKEVSTLYEKDKEYQKKVQDMRSKVAVTKQTVEKEYKDTINFLNSLPKDKVKVTKTAYMDEHRQQMLKENRQHKMQQEYRKIEKECRRQHSCANKSRSKSGSPSKRDDDEDFADRDFQYSWMPVPESDGNLAIHTIPNSMKEGKSGNSVKFSQVDSYHEYRSRHKHTPPTKDTTSHKKHPVKKRVEAVIVDKNASHSSNDSSTGSDTSSVENLKLDKEVKDKQDTNSSDAERIIIYKILDTKNKHAKKKNKILSDIAKSLTSMKKVQKSVSEDNHNEPDNRLLNNMSKPVSKTADNTVSFEHIKEGIYKVTEDKRENLNSIYFTNDQADTEQTSNMKCRCKDHHEAQKTEKATMLQWQTGDISPHPPTSTQKQCQCLNKSKEKECVPAAETPKVTRTPAKQPSASTSTSSFKTATNDKASNARTEGGFIKLVDETGQEAGKFFLGAAGFLQDDGYEVVIQLRKKDSAKDDKTSPNISQQPEQLQSKESVSDYKDPSGSEIIDVITLESPESQSIGQVNNVGDSKMNEVLPNRSMAGKESKKTSPLVSKHSQETMVGETVHYNTKSVSVSSDSSEDIRLIQSSEGKKDVADKAIQNYGKPEPLSRPATTTYTQTTNSPIHRPMYFHMSSSTSTAYMSPPDMILPSFLRQDSGTGDDDTYPLKGINAVYKQVKCNKNNRKCRHAKISSTTNMHVEGSGKNKHSLETPDTTHYHKVSCARKVSRVSNKKCQCHDCGEIPKDNLKTYCHRNKNIHNQPPRNINMFANRNNGKDKCKTTMGHKKNSAASLNPIIKEYINKLLALNKEGLKAIEVADQECSSVGTPGSSIINVPNNVDERKASVGNKISLEYIKSALKQQIIEEHLNNRSNFPETLYNSISRNILTRRPRRKPVHKVKSLNISKRFIKRNKTEEPKAPKIVSLSTTTDDNSKTFASSIACDSKTRSRSSPTPRPVQPSRSSSTYKEYNAAKIPPSREPSKTDLSDEKLSRKGVSPPLPKEGPKKSQTSLYPSHKTTITDTSQDSESARESQRYYKSKTEIPMSMSTQTSQNIDSDLKLAEDKLQNMEKIADLTEKCTKRLSNLAKVLEEVRKNKSLIYSQISASDSTDSHSDNKSDKVTKNTEPIETVDASDRLANESPELVQENEHTNAEKQKPHSEYISFLTDIPKPQVFQLPEPRECNPLPSTPSLASVASPVTTDTSTSEISKCRPKPPPALTRMHLKHGQEFIIPHELSTVIEVDSPMSVKNKKHSSRNDVPSNSNRSSNEDKDSLKDEVRQTAIIKDRDNSVNPDLLQSNTELPKHLKFSSTESSDDSKFQMIDLKHFNDIMLEPFISIHEYAKKYNVEAPDEGSNMEDIHKEDAMNDDVSSLHSDGSLPDVIAELLKRNIITEPFKFDTASNVNSTTYSSESTLSMLALSKVRKGRKRSSVVFHNKENIGETSDTLSISSNPDLENAFKRLGMGWASSTLKKTKERLALSSSSNTSSSSISQFKIKSFNQDIPALVTDSVSSVLLSKKGIHNKKTAPESNSKAAEQQTSFTNSMTVKQFLTNELAKKITFTNNTNVNDTEEEFISLFETKMPEDLKQQSQVNRDERTNDSVCSVNRARTSTPVQIFKSMTYHSSSSSNVSNGLFSNADDLSSVKMTSNSMKNHSTSDKDDLTIPNFSLKMKKSSECSKSD